MLKDIFVMLKDLPLVHDLSTSVNGGVISQLHKGFISVKYPKNKTQAFS